MSAVINEANEAAMVDVLTFSLFGSDCDREDEELEHQREVLDMKSGRPSLGGSDVSRRQTVKIWVAGC